MGWLKVACRVATRCEKRAIHYRAVIHIGVMRQLLERPLPLSDKSW